MSADFNSIAATRRPVVIVDNLHVSYRVLATGKRAKGVNKRLLRKKRQLDTVRALHDISFTVYENESVGIIGHNGSGKSTLMRAIVGLTPASKGAVYTASRPNLLGVGAALISDLSGEQNIILGGLAMGFTLEEITRRCEEIAAFSGLEEFIKYPMKTYSSGMTARLKFAIASARAHDILIVDEALAVGDRAFRKKSEQRIREIREAAGTVFLVSHSMGSIKKTCERVLWIHKGQLRMDGPAEDVVAAYDAQK